jgi:hypothetical protein
MAVPLMGAVIVGPWDGATEPKLEHDEKVAEHHRKWAEFLEELLAETDEPMVPVSRENVEKLANGYRDRERARLDQLERLRPNPERDLKQRIQQLERQVATRDRGWDKYWKLRAKMKRERDGTPLDTLAGLDPKTRGTLWSADIVTVEELIRHTERRNWLIRGVGPKRRTEIIEALKSAPNEEEG